MGRERLEAWLSERGALDTIVALGELFTTSAIFFVDAERSIVYWNKVAEDILGFDAKEAVGHHCLKSVRCPNCMTGCGIAEYGLVRDVPLVMYRVDGKAVHVRKTARAFFDEAGRFTGGVEVFRLDQEKEAPDSLEASHLPTGDSSDAVDFHGIQSRDPAMHQVFSTIQQVAEMGVSVLIRGESGTGKELVARALHLESSRREKPFVAVNCATLTPTLMESQLFGHVKGAFTGAVKEGIGFFRQADGGTLFLDEIAELPLDLQAKLLRVLEERKVMPVGGTRPMAVDVRIVAATHRSLREEVARGRFREDLMYRLRVVPLFLPALHARRGDVELLLWRFIAEYNRRGPRKIESISPEVMRLLLDHTWPGNVRELQNVVAYAFAVGRAPELVLEDLPPEFRDAPKALSTLPVSLSSIQEMEPHRIRTALIATKGNVGKAADMLGISRATLWRKRKRYNI
ncbi:MAG: sigma 54-interacting transcriptional regulator [Myxococcales bacterium]|nr:sigma 54-interacting transcriptional regulator [Myxococcales bacterium]MCB9644572.1 sigma 54-interacting transcriptional regulator [Myxococcales bacterium]